MKQALKTMMMMVMALVLMTSLTMGKEWSHPAGFKFDLPDNFKVKTDGDMLTAEDPTGELGMFFFPVRNAEKLEQALDSVEAAVKDDFKNLKLEDPKEGQINGLDYLSFDGTAKVGDTPVDVTVMIFNKKGTFLVMFGAVNSSKTKSFEPTLVNIFKSLK